jgi:hypothetical protein
MPLVVRAMLVMVYVLTQMLAVAIGAGVVLVMATAGIGMMTIGMMTIGMMTVCTATARAKMEILLVRQLYHQYQC